MRILLIEAPSLHGDGTGQTRALLPLGLAALAATLAPAHEVGLLLPDTLATDLTGAAALDALADRVLAERPELVGIGLTSATFGRARGLTAALAARAPELPLLLGGVHATVAPAAALHASAAHAALAGEADRTLPALLRQLAHGIPLRKARLPGLWRQAPGAGPGTTPQIVPPPRSAAFPALDRLPLPRRAGVIGPPLPASAFSGLTTSRGCCFDCSFCAAARLGGGRVRFRPLPQVLAEVDELRTRWAVPSLFFHDSVLTLSRPRTLALAAGLAARSPALPFTGQTRIDRIDPELLDHLARAGCQQLMYGVETGSPRTGERIGKPLDQAAVRRVARWTRERGILPAAFFIVGFPWETAEDLAATREVALGSGFDAVHLFSAHPLPGSRLGDEFPLDLAGPLDFRTPQRNFTTLPDAEYQQRFTALAADFAAHNLAQVQRRLAWPAGG